MNEMEVALVFCEIYPSEAASGTRKNIGWDLILTIGN